MHTSYTVGITTGEYKALQYVMLDQKEWITNAIQNRARIASDEIVNIYTQYKINKGDELYLRFKKDSLHIFNENGKSENRICECPKNFKNCNWIKKKF